MYMYYYVKLVFLFPTVYMKVGTTGCAQVQYLPERF